MEETAPEAIIRQGYHEAISELRRAEFEEERAKEKTLIARGRVDAHRQMLARLRESEDVQDNPHALVVHSGEIRSRLQASREAPFPWDNLPRSSAILRMLKLRGRPMGPAELSRELKAIGRSRDEPNYVSSTLDNLKRRGLVRSLGEGQWVLVDRIQEDAEGGG